MTLSHVVLLVHRSLICWLLLAMLALMLVNLMLALPGGTGLAVPEQLQNRQLGHQALTEQSSLWRLASEQGEWLLVVDDDGQLLRMLSVPETQLLNGMHLLLEILIWGLVALSVGMFLSKGLDRWWGLLACGCLAIYFVFPFEGISPDMHSSLPLLNALYPGLAACLVLYALARWRRQIPDSFEPGGDLVAYASQSGTAMVQAKKFVEACCHHKELRCLSTLTPEQLTNYKRVLFVASTYGDGEPPDAARAFFKALSGSPASLTNVSYAVMALGDRQYAGYCAFGHQLNAAMAHRGAQAVSEVVEINRGDAAQLKQGWQRLSGAFKWDSKGVVEDWLEASVISNIRLNPEAPGRGVHHLHIALAEAECQPGDLLQVVPQVDVALLTERLMKLGWPLNQQVVFGGNKRPLLELLTELDWQQEQAASAQQLVEQLAPLTPRQYSIACHAKGEVQLLVRRLIKDDGTDGLASGFLCRAKPGQTLRANILSHSRFHPPPVSQALIMIAAGTGIAPFMGFLQERQRAKVCGQQVGPAWLLMGERDPQQDNYFDAQLTQFQQQGILTFRHHAWSQGDSPEYVDGLLRRAEQELLTWITQRDACIYYCGNASGFGASVSQALQDCLGESYQRSLEVGRIRADLY